MARMWLRCPCSSCLPSLSRTPSEVPSSAASTSWTPSALPLGRPCTQPPRISDASPATPPVCTTTRPATASTLCFGAPRPAAPPPPQNHRPHPRHSPGVHHHRAGHHQHPLLLLHRVPHQFRRLPHRGFHLPFRGDAVGHEREREPVAFLRFRRHADAA